MLIIIIIPALIILCGTVVLNFEARIGIWL